MYQLFKNNLNADQRIAESRPSKKKTEAPKNAKHWQLQYSY